MTLNWRIVVEKKFEDFTYKIIRHRFIALFFTLTMIVGLASNLPKITFDTSTEGFLYKDDPQILMHNNFRNQFGRDEKIIVAIKTKDVFNKEFLKKLFKLHKEIEDKVPYIKEVDSLKNARKTMGNKNKLIVEELFSEGIPTEEKKLQAIKEFAQTNSIYKNLYLNSDSTFTSIMITTNTYNDSDDINKLITILESILNNYKSDDFHIYDAGSPIVTTKLQTTLMSDMSKFILLLILIIAIVLFLTFKRISGVIIPLLIVISTLLSTMGSMALFGYPITSMTQILPSLVLAVAIGDSIHILAIFFNKFDESGDKNHSIAYAIGHSGLAVFMTSVTTAASLASFAISDIAPVTALGIFSATGIFLALILTIIFIPIALSLIPLKPKVHLRKNYLDAIMLNIANFSINHYKTIISSSVAVIIISLILASQIQFSHNPLHWFKKENIVRINTEVIDKEMHGSISIEVVLDTGIKNGIYNPRFLNTIEEVTKEIYKYKGENYFIGKILSINDLLKEIHMALNENRKSFYLIPQNKELIAEEFLLFENSGNGDLEDIVDSEFSKTHLSIKVPWVNSIEYVDMINKLKNLLDTEFKGMANVSVTGTLPILSTTITKSIRSSIDSYIIAFCVITLFMIILIGNFKLGLLSMIPNLTPIIFAIAFMVIFKLPLDMFTILIGTIAIGMVVDDTIHYMHNFKRYYIIHNDVDEAIRKTLHTTGRAIFITSIVLSSGFLVFIFANMTNLFNFGLITGITAMVAMATNLILTGALMKFFIKSHVDV